MTCACRLCDSQRCTESARAASFARLSGYQGLKHSCQDIVPVVRGCLQGRRPARAGQVARVQEPTAVPAGTVLRCHPGWQQLVACAVWPWAE